MNYTYKKYFARTFTPYPPAKSRTHRPIFHFYLHVRRKQNILFWVSQSWGDRCPACPKWL